MPKHSQPMRRPSNGFLLCLQHASRLWGHRKPVPLASRDVLTHAVLAHLAPGLAPKPHVRGLKPVVWGVLGGGADLPGPEGEKGIRDARLRRSKPSSPSH